MNASKMRLWDRIHGVEPATRQIAFRTLGLASKHLGIELNQSFPVPGDQICMNVLSANWHCVALSKSSRTTIGLLMILPQEKESDAKTHRSPTPKAFSKPHFLRNAHRRASFLFAKLWGCAAMPACMRASSRRFSSNRHYY